MKLIKSASVCMLALFALLSQSCQVKDNANEQKEQPVEVKADTVTYAGNYVTDEYSRRNEGYDWVAVSVSELSDSVIRIKIRSRADKKRPTCTFDAQAGKISTNQFRSVIDGKAILYSFTRDSVEIAAENEAGKDYLQYYCSGGGSIGGKYKKLQEPLDQAQIDQRVFIKTLNMQNIGFEVSTTGEGSLQQLSIKPFGLKIDNREVRTEIEGSVMNAEVEDLNSDGFPELLIYTISAGSGSYGNVIGYSVNNGKSLSSIYFPPVSDNKEAGKGYMGHDEFAIVETRLVQRFKTYAEGDANSSATGNIRQIQYKLVDGEAGRKFVVDRIVEFPGK